MTHDESLLDASQLDVELDVPVSGEEMLVPDVYVGLEIDLLAPCDGVVTDAGDDAADRDDGSGRTQQDGGVLDAQLRRIRSWSTALQYIEEYCRRFELPSGGRTAGSGGGR